MTTPTKTMNDIRDESAKQFIFDNWGKRFEGDVVLMTFRSGFDCRDKLGDEALKIAVEALENIYGDGSYKDIASEFAQKALTEIQKITGNK